jgi:hypothetical protein
MCRWQPGLGSEACPSQAAQFTFYNICLLLTALPAGFQEGILWALISSAALQQHFRSGLLFYY